MQRLSNQSGLENTPIGRLYQLHWQELFTVIRQSVFSREDAEDILLDVFLAAMESSILLSLSELQQKAWLRRVAYNKCMDFHRRTTRHPTASLDDHIDIFDDDKDLAPEQVALRQEEIVQLREHVARLTADQQEILRLRFVDGLRCAQIATRMRKSEGAIRSSLVRVFNRLRGIYTEQRKENDHG